MEQLIIKIGGDMKKDLKKVFDDPSKAKTNTHTLYLKNTEEFHKLISPKRLNLLMYIIEHQSEKKTISEIAKELKRKQEAISRDAIMLEKYNLIQKIKEKQMTYLRAIYKSLDIRLANA